VLYLTGTRLRYCDVDHSIVEMNECERVAMSEDQEAGEERPCLHCLMVELIDNFFAEYCGDR
jgi:hypothetical protein